MSIHRMLPRTRRSARWLALCLVLFAAPAQSSLAQETSRQLLVGYAGLISTHTGVWLGEDHGFY